MQPNPTCPHCGVELAEDAPKGFCGQCLLLLGMSDLPSTADLPDPPSLESGNQDSMEVIHYFGDYELLKEIARGGMGVVYKARQTSLNRIVAVKMILGGYLARKEFIERFRQEARAAANLQHPNIVAIHEVGEHAGQHYFSMDYVEGRNLVELLADFKGGTVESRRAARWMKIIAEAIQYAHEQGTIHRDLKPSNILIDRNDEPQITDFGLAKSLKRDSELTVSGQVMGTPSFLPPEQASGSRVAVGPRSDVYGLGAVLYFLLTGRAPVAGETLEATLHQVLHHEPVSPRLLNPGIPRDLETICLKCLEKDPKRRYASAQELADELDRFLEGRPIRARPVGTAGRALRWCRRKPLVAGLGAGLVLALVLGFAGVAWQWRQTEQERQVQRRIAYVASIRAAQLALEQNKRGLAVTLLRQQCPEPGDGEDLRGVEWQYLWQESRSDELQKFLHPAQLKDVALSPDGRFLVTLAWDDKVRIWEVGTRRLIKILASQSFPSPRKSLAFSGDGRHLVFPGPEGIEILETSGWTRLQTLEGAGAPLCLSTNGERLISVEPISHQVLQIWDLQNGTKGELTSEGLVGLYNLAMTPDGSQIAFSTSMPFWGRFGQILLRDHETGQTEVLQEQSGCMSLAVSPNGRWLASGHLSGEVCCWRLADRQLAVRFKAHSGATCGLAFSPDSKVLATGGTDALICLWEAGTTNRLDSWAAMGAVRVLSFSQDGQKIASGSWAGRTARLWDLQRRGTVDQTFHVPSDAVTLGSLPDGSALVTSGAGWRINCFWRLPDGLLIRSNFWDANRLRGCTELRSFPANRLAVGVDTNGTVHLWDLATQTHQRSMSVGEREFTAAYLSPNGKWLLGFGSDGTGVLCDLDVGRSEFLPVQKSLTYPADFSPDGRWLAYCINSSTIKLWDLAANRVSRTLEQGGLYVTVLRFSPDSKVLASGYADAALKIWSVRTGKLMMPPLKGHQSFLHQVAFSPDGRTLVSCDTDLTSHWWNLTTGREMLLLRESSMVGGSEYLAFESYYGAKARLIAGGKWVVQQGRQGLIRVTSLPTLAEVDTSERALEDEERTVQ